MSLRNFISRMYILLYTYTYPIAKSIIYSLRNYLFMIKINTVKHLYKKLFFFSPLFLIERFSYKEVFTFPMILIINL